MITAVPTGQRTQVSVDCYTFVVLKTKQQKDISTGHRIGYVDVYQSHFVQNMT